MLLSGSLRWSSRIGTTARRAILPDGAVFESNDNDQIDLLERAQGPGCTSRLHRLENLGAPFLVLATLIAVAVLISLRWAIPWIGDAAAQLVPQAVEARIGTGVLDTLDRVALNPTQLPLATRQTIQAVFDDLALQADVPAGRLQLLFRQGGRLVGANALALPGGQIVVTDELADLAQTADSLAGVLAHEIGHVQHRHGMRRLGRIAGLSVVALLITGDVTSAVHDIGVLGTGLLDLSYSRQFEGEADAGGVALMRKVGRDPALLAGLLEKLGEKSGAAGETSRWLSSHPSTGERIRLIREER